MLSEMARLMFRRWKSRAQNMTHAQVVIRQSIYHNQHKFRHKPRCIKYLLDKPLLFLCGPCISGIETMGILISDSFILLSPVIRNIGIREDVAVRGARGLVTRVVRRTCRLFSDRGVFGVLEDTGDSHVCKAAEKDIRIRGRGDVNEICSAHSIVPNGCRSCI